MLSSLLLNSEAWVNISDKDIRSLEQTDESLLAKIWGCDAKTSNAFKYLELGIYPIRFEIMKRKIRFLQYILQQDKSSMIYQVLQTQGNIQQRKTLKVSNIELTFEKLARCQSMNLKIMSMREQ